MLTTLNEVDMTNLMKFRSDYKDAFVEKHGVKLGFMSRFVKLLLKVPVVKFDDKWVSQSNVRILEEKYPRGFSENPS